jgi:hypothetical protein
MTSKSKIKGNAWEREICKVLSEHLGGIFTRTPHSGAFIGGKNSFRKQSLSESSIRTYKGDIVPPASFPFFNIEAKNYNDFQFHQLFSESKQLDAWIAQTLEPADEFDINLTIFKVSRRGSWIAFEEKLLSKFNLTTNYMKYKNHYVIDFESFIISNTEPLRLLGANGNNQ